jgi:hypothetical protein
VLSPLETKGGGGGGEKQMNRNKILVLMATVFTAATLAAAPAWADNKGEGARADGNEQPKWSNVELIKGGDQAKWSDIELK